VQDQDQDQDQLTHLVRDARRFVMYHKQAIESYPLQTYASALLFSPTGSLIKRLFEHEEPEGITIGLDMCSNWSACLQTLEGHSSGVNSVAFSHDSAQLASASDDKTVKIWDVSSGTCLRTLKGHSSEVSSVAFSHDSTQLASASYDKTVKIWDVSSGACLQTINTSETLHELSFNSISSCLYTEIGPITINSSQATGIDHPVEQKRPLRLRPSVSFDKTWIQYGGANMLWVPSEYRPSCSSVCGSIVGIGAGSGKVWSCRIDL
jgi:WD40 repeat protein